MCKSKHSHYPRHRTIASDDEYTLFGVVVFKRVHDEFIQKCRENRSEYTIVVTCTVSDYVSLRFIVRDFVYSEEQIAKQRDELTVTDTTEKELWVRFVMDA